MVDVVEADDDSIFNLIGFECDCSGGAVADPVASGSSSFGFFGRI